MKKATIYDYARMCRTYFNDCTQCPMWDEKCGISGVNDIELDKTNEIILNWCKEHPAETRQSKIQKIIPTILLNASGEYVDICPNEIDVYFNTNKLCENYAECSDCKREYWLAEVDKK